MPAAWMTPCLRVFFYLLYHPLAFAYDWVAAAVSLGRWQSWVQAVLPYLTGPRILELGHGPGHLQIDLQQRHFAVSGLDESAQMGRLARRRLHSLGLSPRLVRGRAQHLPFASQFFHQVVATFPSDYILQSETLAEVRRVLVPDGQLVILPVAWITGQRPLQRLLAGLFRWTGQAPATVNPDQIAGAVRPLLAQAGFATQVIPIQQESSLLVVILATCSGS